jgi:hypothetical protein
MSIETFKNKLLDHDILALETYFNDSPIVALPAIDFKLDLVKLRHKISAIVSNSWVKAKKKCLIENENHFVGLKSLFHSCRILSFGLQLAETGKITDFSCSQEIWYEILKMDADGIGIIEIMLNFKPQHNANATKFRNLTPKEY